MGAVAQFMKQILMDIIINGSVYAVLQYVNISWKAPSVGFFCSDISIRYPYMDSPFNSYLFYIILFWTPIVIVLTNSFITVYCTKEYRETIIDVYKILSIYILGFTASSLTVAIAKNNVGRLRPNFHSVCKPNVDCNATSPYTYIQNFTCAKEADNYFVRMSFPSQHATLSFYVAVFVMLYLQKRSFKGDAFERNVKIFVQVMILQAAWLVAIDRIKNFFHRESDVLAGIIIGSFWAVTTIKYFLKLDASGEESLLHDEGSSGSLQLKGLKYTENNFISHKENTPMKSL